MSGGTGGGIALLTASANATGTAFEVTRFGHLHESHLRTVFAYGTWDSATLAIQISPDNTNWIAIANADTITADTVVNIEFRAPYIRAVLASGLGSESVTVKVL